MKRKPAAPSSRPASAGLQYLKIARERRPLTCAMQEAEKAVERHVRSVLDDLHPQSHVVRAALVKVVNDVDMALFLDQRFPDHAGLIHNEVRQQLFGVEHALRILAEAPSFPAPAYGTTAALLRRTAKVIQMFADYATLRDLFLSYAWDLYDVESREPSTLRFFDPPAYPGFRDRAQRHLTQIVDASRVPSVSLPLEMAFLHMHELSEDFDLDGIGSQAFAKTWIRLGFAVRQGEVPTAPRRCDLVNWLGGLLTTQEAEAFLRIVTFEPRQHGSLSLFHTPLVPYSADRVMIVLPGLGYGRLSGTMPRLILHRTRKKLPQRLAKDFVRRLCQHFAASKVCVASGIPYHGRVDQGDIDLAAYEVTTDTLVLAEAKAFLLSDTVEEVVQANHKLAEGIEQIQRVRAWIEESRASAIGQLRTRLEEQQLSTRTAVQYAIIGNGFAGSDYLDIPPDVHVVDGRFLLMPRFRGGSLSGAILAYQEQLHYWLEEFQPERGTMAISLAGWTFEAPGELLTPQEAGPSDALDR